MNMRNRYKNVALGLILISILGLLLNISFANARPLQTNYIYMPIIFSAPPAPILFPNGDFEQGPGIWTEFSTHGWELIVNGFPYGFTAYDGTWAVWLGGDFNEISYIEQQVTVPSNLHYLSFWYWIDSEDVCGNDFGHVSVNSNEVVDYNLCESNNTNGWVQEVIDLSAYAGQSVVVQIKTECDAQLNSNLFIDHVGFQYSSSSTSAVPETITTIDASSITLDLIKH
jgi:hypothetical protein